jgi:hypothetical protein
MSEDFPYGAKPRHPEVRNKVMAQIDAFLAAKQVYENRVRVSASQFDKIQVDPYQIRDALALTPVTDPDAMVIGQAEDLTDKELLAVLKARVDSGSLVAGQVLNAVTGPLMSAGQTFTGEQIAEDLDDEVLLNELATRLEDPGFAHTVGEMIGKRLFGWFKGFL